MVDGRIHFALSACAAVLKTGPKLPSAARILIIDAMQLLIDANDHIDKEMKEKENEN